ncbi:subtilisin-like protease SBT1.3 [Arachis hypogaea]|uniref:subtilisin-like protease SBT1.3 n=1 Tax=Arachis hypogaea TaxID=3818 RepID=UPI003B21AC59
MRRGKMVKNLKNYVLINKNATATFLFLGTRLGIRPSPLVVASSSREPNFLSLEVLKPDLVAPGVNILVAWSEDVGPLGLRVKFSIVSGTSMSSPHVSGVAALIKAKHPQWSPAAIKSALMTIAYVVDNTMKPLKDVSNAEKPSSPYDHGASHINPTKALDPSLVYDIKPQDYLDFLCTQNLTPNQLGVFGKYANRSCAYSLASPGDLNYPAISLVFAENKSISSQSRKQDEVEQRCDKAIRGEAIQWARQTNGAEHPRMTQTDDDHPAMDKDDATEDGSRVR